MWVWGVLGVEERKGGSEVFSFGLATKLECCFVLFKVLERPGEPVFTVTPFTLLSRSRWWGVGTVQSGLGARPHMSLMTSVWVFHLLAKRYHTCPDKPFDTPGECGKKIPAPTTRKESCLKVETNYVRIYPHAVQKRTTLSLRAV